MSHIEEKLNQIIPSYQKNKYEMDYFKKLADIDNSEIKDLMKQGGYTEFAVGDVKAVLSVSERVDFNEPALIEVLKEMKVKGIIKKKEYVDSDALENAIYHGKIDAAVLAGCQTIKEVTSLRIAKNR